MIDVIQALELLEICADEMATEHENDQQDDGGAPRRRVSLTARALGKLQLSIDALSRWPLGSRANIAGTPRESTMTIGALIVFRTAHRFGRAGASTERTIDAVYCAAHRYLEMIPQSLQDDVDKVALRELMAESEARTTRGTQNRELHTGTRRRSIVA